MIAMNKKWKSMGILALSALLFVGCTQSTTVEESTSQGADFEATLEDNVLRVNSENATEENAIFLSGLEVEETQKLIGTAELEDETQIHTVFIKEDGNQEITFDNLDQALNGDLGGTTWDFLGKENLDLYLEPGSYTVALSPVGTTTGSLIIQTTGTYNSVLWNNAKNDEDASEKAGIAALEIPDQLDISLGALKVYRYRYVDGVIEADIPAGAVQLLTRKGDESVASETYDTRTFAHQWTMNIDDIEVTCFGNREGDSSKTTWTKDGSTYCISAYGEGGDTDYGLKQDDIEILVRAIH